MNANVEDRLSMSAAVGAERQTVINSDILSRITRLQATIDYAAKTAMECDGPMNKVSVVEVGCLLGLMSEEAARISNAIDRLNGGV